MTPSEALPEAQTIRDLFRQMAFRVVAPTAAEGYARLREFVAPLVSPRRQMQRNPARPLGPPRSGGKAS